ncbi:MAG: Omp28-related outer membrane protein [Bacteroidia bacterium]
MKKLLVLATVVSLAFFSCKDKGEDPDNGNGGTAPLTYTQKVLVEYTTCAGCPYCPDAKVYTDKLATKYGADAVYPVAMHDLNQGADMMANDESKAFSSIYYAGNPTGMVNRLGGKSENRGNWDGRAKLVIDDDAAKCGLAINCASTGVNKFKVTLKVGVGAADLPAGKYYVIGYLVNKEMSGVGSGWNQANGYNTTAGHPMYGKGSPVVGYIHHNVFVKSLGGISGTLIDAANMKAGSLSEYNYDVDMSGADISKMDVVAFVYFKSVSAPYVENVQRIKLGENKAFD